MENKKNKENKNLAINQYHLVSFSLQLPPKYWIMVRVIALFLTKLTMRLHHHQRIQIEWPTLENISYLRPLLLTSIPPFHSLIYCHVMVVSVLTITTRFSPSHACHHPAIQAVFSTTGLYHLTVTTLYIHAASMYNNIKYDCTSLPWEICALLKATKNSQAKGTYTRIAV